MTKLLDFIRYSFLRGIKNLIRYFKIVWEDRDYDWTYTYDFLVKKLEYQRKNLASICYYPKEQQRISDCIYLLKRLRDGDYYYEQVGKGYKKVKLSDIFELEKRDTEYAFKLFAKWSQTWWT